MPHGLMIAIFPELRTVESSESNARARFSSGAASCVARAGSSASSRHKPSAASGRRPDSQISLSPTQKERNPNDPNERSHCKRVAAHSPLFGEQSGGQKMNTPLFAVRGPLSSQARCVAGAEIVGQWFSHPSSRQR